MLVLAMDLRQPASSISQIILKSTRDRIQSTKMSPEGGRWAPLSSKYAAKKGRQDLLVLKGQLLKSIRTNTKFTMGRAEVEVTSSVPYAATHQFGRRNIPARPYIGFSTKDKADIQKVLDDHAKTAFRGLFR